MKRYYSILRPVGIGTYPKSEGNKVLNIINFDERKFVDEIEREAWGYLEYENELTEKEARSYDLITDNIDRENKQKICNLLCKTLQQTRALHDLISIDYVKRDEDNERAIVSFTSGSRIKINVTADSGIAMISDIIKKLN